MRGGSPPLPMRAAGAEALQRRRQARGGREQRALAARAAAARGAAGAGEGVEQDRRGGGAADQARHRRAVGPADPDADGHAAVEADRPGVAVAVGGAGLEGDAAGRRVVGRRRADEDIADIPGGDRIEQPAAGCGGLPPRRSISGSDVAEPRAGRHRASTRSASVMPTPPRPMARPGASPVGSTSAAPACVEPRGQAVDADLVEHRDRRDVERELQRPAHRHRALEREVEILRRVAAEARSAGRRSASPDG